MTKSPPEPKRRRNRKARPQETGASPDGTLEMPFLSNVGLVMTYKCQVACPHCIIEAGPHRTEEMLLADALDWVRQVAGYREGCVRFLSLTGGEPFHNLGNLGRVSAFGASCGLTVSVVTNAYWATTIPEAIGILRSLPAIRLLAISSDIHHQQAIPFERVGNAAHAAKTCGIPFNIGVCTENEDDPEYQTLLAKLREITEPGNIHSVITFPAGRALKKLGTQRYKTSREPPVSACTSGGSPVIFPDGKVVACIGPVIDLRSRHPLVAGNLRENSLAEILDRAETNPVLQAIRIWGPRKLISLIREAGLAQHLPSAYIEGSICNACYDLMASPQITGFLDQLASDGEFQRKVAYARVYYLKETRMAELLGLTG